MIVATCYYNLICVCLSVCLCVCLCVGVCVFVWGIVFVFMHDAVHSPLILPLLNKYIGLFNFYMHDNIFRISNILNCLFWCINLIILFLPYFLNGIYFATYVTY